MENHLIKDLMVPISEYATVKIGTSLNDAIRVLDSAQAGYRESKYQHRAILVLDDRGNVVGKISQLRALKAIEPEFDFNVKLAEMQDLKFSEEYLTQLRERFRAQGEIINRETLKKSACKRVEDFMQTLSPGEYVSEDSSIDTAIHKLVTGTLLSLLVTRDEAIVGILRISDVFSAVFQDMIALDK